jgi:hypothetical protein
MKKSCLRASALFFLFIGLVPLALFGPWCRHARRAKPCAKPTSIHKPSRLAPLKPLVDERDRTER